MSEINGESVAMTPQYGFYAVTIEIMEEDPETGKVKKIKEEHLVDAPNLTAADAKVKKEMDGLASEWKVVKCVTSKISVIY